MDTPRHQSLVPGICLHVISHTKNPALSPEFGDPALLDGYVDILTVSDGTNPDFPTVGQWRTLLVRKEPHTALNFANPENASIIPLYPNDILVEILILQDSLVQSGVKELYGLWQVVRFKRSDSEHFSALVLLQSLDQTIQQQYRYGGH